MIDYGGRSSRPLYRAYPSPIWQKPTPTSRHAPACTAVMQRREEILAKKAKLEELRRQRAEREQRQKEHGRRESALGGSVLGGGAAEEADRTTRVSTPRRSTDRKELDSLIDTLVGERLTTRSPGAASPAAGGRRNPRPSTLAGGGGGVQVGSETYEQNGAVTPGGGKYVTAETQTLGVDGGETLATERAKPLVGRTPEYVTYEKFTQTAEIWPSPRRRRGSENGGSGSESDGITRSPGSMKEKKTRRERDREEELRANLRREIEEELKAVDGQSTNDRGPSAVSNFPARELTSEELNAVTSSEDFLEFVDRSSKVIEKALDQDYDVLADYALGGLELDDEEEDEGYVSGRSKKGRRIRQTAQFFEERWCKKRMISDLNFSPKFPELLLASYTKNPSAPQDPSGLLQIWNMHLHSRPEYTFHATSDILTATFSPFHPSLIIGGSYTGQVLLWDTRSRSPLPAQKTPLTGASTGGHTHPIYSISLVGTQNANNIISCSTDGVVCGWTTDMLTVPQEYLELTTPPPSKTEDLAPTCMTFPESDPTSFLVGTEEGTVFPCHRYDRAGAKAGVDAKQRYKGHSAPVMSLDFHPARGPVDLGDLFLSTSLDWSIKLWKTRPVSSTVVQSSQSTTATAASALTSYGNPTSSEQIVEPLIDIPREDVVYSARWSPHRPGIFASVDGGGNVEVWDLTLDTEVPVAKASPFVDRSVNGLGGHLAKSLDKVCWEGKEGKRLAVGGAAGIVTVYEVGSELAGGEGVRGEEWARMKRVIERGERAAR